MILLGCLVSAISACTVVSSPQALLPFDMDEEARRQISSTRVLISTNLDALENEKLADSDYWLDTDYIDQPLSGLEADIKRLKWLHIKKTLKLNAFLYEKIAAEIAGTQEEALLFIDMRYRMSPDYTALLATSHVSLFPRKKDLITIADAQYQDGKFPVLYRNQFNYEYRYEGGYQDEQSTALAWFDNDAAMVKKALGAAVKAISAMVVRDMAVIPTRPDPKRSGNRAPNSLYDYK